jgi:hypothetical protein
MVKTTAARVMPAIMPRDSHDLSIGNIPCKIGKRNPFFPLALVVIEITCSL